MGVATCIALRLVLRPIHRIRAPSSILTSRPGSLVAGKVASCPAQRDTVASLTRSISATCFGLRNLPLDTDTSDTARTPFWGMGER